VLSPLAFRNPFSLFPLLTDPLFTRNRSLRPFLNFYTLTFPSPPHQPKLDNCPRGALLPSGSLFQSSSGRSAALPPNPFSACFPKLSTQASPLTLLLTLSPPWFFPLQRASVEDATVCCPLPTFSPLTHFTALIFIIFIVDSFFSFGLCSSTWLFLGHPNPTPPKPASPGESSLLPLPLPVDYHPANFLFSYTSFALHRPSLGPITLPPSSKRFPLTFFFLLHLVFLCNDSCLTSRFFRRFPCCLYWSFPVFGLDRHSGPSFSVCGFQLFAPP